MQLVTQTPEMVEAQYALVQAAGHEISRDTFDAYITLWNAALPEINRACDPMGALNDLTAFAMRNGMEMAQAEVARQEGRICEGCYAALVAALPLVQASIEMVMASRLITGVQALVNQATDDTL